eukprot:CAMPEP_0117420714 /NCGR_PEP_ID=MMETSP0758-20121206/1990_1 /TAXON_ID=63605 /ORGANISM="Percolomonas cosmopolitus, Strain AE-1 (ATCC 50343)" /LENGTH=671 /DNA_ID=CAMNT_0005202483 /DNA_START=1020 /DNA_END=3032 /DNA_ORIENTATION=-
MLYEEAIPTSTIGLQTEQRTKFPTLTAWNLDQYIWDAQQDSDSRKKLINSDPFSIFKGMNTGTLGNIGTMVKSTDKMSIQALENELQQTINTYKIKLESLESVRSKMDKTYESNKSRIIKIMTTNNITPEKMSEHQLEMNELEIKHRRNVRSYDEKLEKMETFYENTIRRMQTELKRRKFYEKYRHQVELNEAPTGVVTIVTTEIEGAQDMLEKEPTSFAKALELHNYQVREKLNDCHGYEISVSGGSFTIGFREPMEAIQFSLQLQMVLMENVRYPKKLLLLEQAKTEKTKTGKLLYHGLRVKIGIHRGNCIIHPDPVSGRIVYSGDTITKTSYICKYSLGGQITASDEAMSKIDSENRSFIYKPHIIDIGAKKLGGFSGQTRLFAILPNSVRERRHATSVKDIHYKYRVLLEEHRTLKLEHQHTLKKNLAMDEELQKVKDELAKVEHDKMQAKILKHKHKHMNNEIELIKKELERERSKFIQSKKDLEKQLKTTDQSVSKYEYIAQFCQNRLKELDETMNKRMSDTYKSRSSILERANVMLTHDKKILNTFLVPKKKDKSSRLMSQVPSWTPQIKFKAHKAAEELFPQITDVSPHVYNKATSDVVETKVDSSPFSDSWLSTSGKYVDLHSPQSYMQLVEHMIDTIKELHQLVEVTSKERDTYKKEYFDW